MFRSWHVPMTLRAVARLTRELTTTESSPFATSAVKQWRHQRSPKTNSTQRIVAAPRSLDLDLGSTLATEGDRLSRVNEQDWAEYLLKHRYALAASAAAAGIAMAACTVLLLFAKDWSAGRVKMKVPAAILFTFCALAGYVAVSIAYLVLHQQFVFRLTGVVTLCHWPGALARIAPVFAAAIGWIAYRHRESRGGVAGTILFAISGVTSLAAAVAAVVIRPSLNPDDLFVVAATSRTDDSEILIAIAAAAFGASIVIARGRRAKVEAPNAI